MITKADIKALIGGRNPKINIDDLVINLNKAMARYEINTPLRVHHFLAQVAHESDGFNTTEEYASGSAYEGRKDLGNTEEGDGKRFKGRGLIQLTGRSNYQKYSDATGSDFVRYPQLLSKIDNGMYADVAGWFWKRAGLNELADKDDLKAITKRINGGYNGLDDRMKYLAKAKLYLKNLAGFVSDNKIGLGMIAIVGGIAYLITRK